MISTQVESAVRAFQARALATKDGYELDVSERALDELIRSPRSLRPPAFQVRNARANAAKVIQARRRIHEQDILRNRLSRPGVQRPERLVEPTDETSGILDWLARTPSLTDGQRAVLFDLAEGHDAHTISVRDQVPLSRIQERISRARRVGWEAYQHEVIAS